MRLTQVNQKGEGGIFPFVILSNQVLRWVPPGYMRCALLGSAEPWPSWGWVQKVDLGWQWAGAGTRVSAPCFPQCSEMCVWVLGYVGHRSALQRCKGSAFGTTQACCSDLRTSLPYGTPHCMPWKTLISSLSRPVGHRQCCQGRIRRLLLPSTMHRVRTLFLLAGKRKHRTLAGVLSFDGNQLPTALAF